MAGESDFGMAWELGHAWRQITISVARNRVLLETDLSLQCLLQWSLDVISQLAVCAWSSDA